MVNAVPVDVVEFSPRERPRGEFAVEVQWLVAAQSEQSGLAEQSGQAS
jgi:hypothetical protein